MIRITHDVFDIADRIKSIDSRYELFFNRKTRRYEVYIGDVLESIIPYNTLDYRTERYLRRTRRENVERLLREIDRDNLRLEEERRYEVKRRAENMIEEIMK